MRRKALMTVPVCPQISENVDPGVCYNAFIASLSRASGYHVVVHAVSVPLLSRVDIYCNKTH